MGTDNDGWNATPQESIGPRDVGKDESLSFECLPDNEEPVKGDRVYRLKDLARADSDAGFDPGDVPNAWGPNCSGVGRGRDLGRFSTQNAVLDDTTAAMLPSAAVFNIAQCGARPLTRDPRCSSRRFSRR